MTASITQPELPLPSEKRWQPLRLGLVNLFYYDSEEFWFCDGHLLLRGNNGTGKSKVLSLTLPFLFDAQVKSSRIEPDGDAGKKMAWNLLLGKHDRRMGYAWIEFGRLAENGEPTYLTLGAGLSAAAARPQVDSWFFMLDRQRIGRDIWLTGPQRVVLTKERLREALEGHGQVFPTHEAYRRAVDDRLFRLGSVRYAALMDTLIQLRQPQLSKKPDEGSLSNALTEALPPLSPELLGDVAEAMNQLEEDRRQLEEYEKLAQAVGQFNARYKIYAGMRSRRQARELRSAQTGFDNASGELKSARESLEKARHAEQACISTHDETASSLHQHRARLEELLRDPAMRDANRMADVTREVEARNRDHVNAERLYKEAQSRLDRETTATAMRSESLATTERELGAARMQQAVSAQPAGVADSYASNPLAALPTQQIALLEDEAFAIARDDLHRLVSKRREEIKLLRRRHEEVVQARRTEEQRLQTLDERRSEKEEAALRRECADTEAERQGERLVTDWQSHVDRLRQLQVPHADTVLLELAAWVVKLDGENPAASALLMAQQEASTRLAASRVELSRSGEELQVERRALEAERARLETGEDAQPPKPFYRAGDIRAGRPGAPLWKLIEFQDEIGESQRAGLEAALEASGLLDAWVAPDGRLQDAAGTDFAQQPLHDTRLVPRPHISSSLADWLRPASGDTAVSASVIAQLLEGVACGKSDVGDAEAWVSPHGHFRLGGLAGAWSKPAAAFIGFAARAAARKQRLEEIDRRMMELEVAEARIRDQLEQNRIDQEQAAAEWRQAPTDDKLRAAHAEAGASARAYQLTAERAERAEADYQAAAAILRSAREQLAADAADLHLPSTLEELEEVETALDAFHNTLHHLLRIARDLRMAIPELQRQQEREEQTRQDAEERAQELAEREQILQETQARLDLLRETVGEKVEVLQQKLMRAHESVGTLEKEFSAAGEEKTRAAEKRGNCEGKVETLDATFQKAVTERQEAVRRLQQYAATGLIAVALPDLEVPDQQAQWTIEPALNLARRIEQALIALKDDDDAWHRMQNQISLDLTELQRALGALHHQAQAETTDYGLLVFIVYQNRPERPDRLGAHLDVEIAQRHELLTAREREVLENHLQAEIATALQKLMQEADRQVDAINDELDKRPTSTGVKFRLQWLPLEEGSEGAPVGLEAARKRLLNTSTDLWSAEDRNVVGAMLQQRIAAERERADAAGGGSMLDQLAQALDYRRWHRFAVQRWQDGQWRKLSGPASSGERALGLTVPLFAAVASFYTQGGYAHAPRLVLLDEAFAGIDDTARAHCMGLIKEFDLDFVITSEREWACYATLPGVSICHLQRREGIDAVHVSRWTWNGRTKRPEPDPDRRFAET
jgi:uncharacterized protein (TIGR02680 family)